MSTGSTDTDVFLVQYAKFVSELMEVCPELDAHLRAAVALTDDEKRARFRTEVLPFCSPARDPTTCPERILPGVAMSKQLWDSLSDTTQLAIQEYLTVLSFTLLVNSGDSLPEGFTPEAAETIFKQLREKFSSMDFSSLAEKLKSLFGSSTGEFTELPERFKNGQIMKLATDIMNEFKPEEFGLDPKMMEEANANPMRAFQMLSEVYMKNPQALQSVIKRIHKKMQQKIQSGQLRPQQLAAEAKELMEYFTENPKFVELMEFFRSTFGFEDPDLARAAGQEQSARLSLVRERLRKKLEKRRGGGGGSRR